MSDGLWLRGVWEWSAAEACFLKHLFAWNLCAVGRHADTCPSRAHTCNLGLRVGMAGRFVGEKDELLALLGAEAVVESAQLKSMSILIFFFCFRLISLSKPKSV